jgi:probable phosphoglycerate mutase
VTAAGHVVVEADGGSRGNPGPAGYGAVVRSGSTVLAERSGTLGVTTNNVAEYSGLIAGLRAAAELGADEVDVRMDSKLVVEQMAGRWQIKHPGLRPLAAEAAALVQQFRAVRFTWIPREQNKHADKLANAAMDALADPPVPLSGTVPEPPLSGTAPEPPLSGTAPESPLSGTAPEPPSGSVPEPPPVAGPDSAARAAARAVASAAAASVASAATASVASAAAASVASAGSASASSSARPSWEPRPTGSALRLLLVRHGETALTAERRYSGRVDVPLTTDGVDQARAVATRVAAIAPNLAAVVTSPLSRCVDTAAAVSTAVGGAPVVIDDDLIECDFGDWEGMTFAEVRSQFPAELDAWLASTSVPPPGGESFQVVALRARRAMQRLRDTYAAQQVAVVSHVTPIKLILRDALAANDAFLHRLYLDAAGLSIMDSWPDGGVAVRSVNDTAHLPHAPF